MVDERTIARVAAAWKAVCANSMIEAADRERMNAALLDALAPAPAGDALLVLHRVMEQSERDLASAHAEIVKLQGGDPAKLDEWPEWSPQANSLRWFAEIRAALPLPAPPRPAAAQPREDGGK